MDDDDYIEMMDSQDMFIDELKDEITRLKLQQEKIKNNKGYYFHCINKDQYCNKCNLYNEKFKTCVMYKIGKEINELEKGAGV